VEVTKGDFIFWTACQKEKTKCKDKISFFSPEALLHKQRRLFILYKWLEVLARICRVSNALSKSVTCQMRASLNTQTTVFNDLQIRGLKSLATSLIMLQDTKLTTNTDLRIRHKLKVCSVGNTLDRSSSQIVNGLDICTELKQNPARAQRLNINNFSK
jgi:hypothetical protein